MKCKWHECDNEARAKSPFCSGTCKKRYQRTSGTNVPVEVGQRPSGTEVGQGAIINEESVVSYENYLKYQPLGMYATRANPETLNWGAWMDKAQLKQNGKTANRVTLPGDWEYKGCCIQVVGVWRAA